jgi:PAS domain S-box-containing protein
MRGGRRSLPYSPLDLAVQAIVATDPDRRITYWNQGAERLYGWTADEVLGRDVIEVTTFEQEPGEEVLQPVEQGDCWAGEFMVRNRDGGRFPAFVTISPLADDKGQPAGVIGLSFALPDDRRDERQYQAQAQLAERKLHYDALFEAMSEGFALCEAEFAADGRLKDYTVLEMNPALQRMLGVGPEAVGGKLSDSPGEHGQWLALCDRVLKTGRPAAFEYNHLPSGRWHEVRINRLREGHMAQFFFDVTARKEAESRQAQLFDELNHRVRNNLNLVSGILQMKARAADHSVVQDQLLRAVARVQSIAQVHDALYRGARKDDVDFGAYLHDLCDSISKSLMRADHVTLKVEADSAMVTIDAAIPLGMVVNELVTNALKYAYAPDEHGTIEVEFRRNDAGFTLSVRDSGPGLPTGLGEQSTGLGMKLIKSLVLQIGGKLSVKHGPGAAFEIKLPDSARFTPAPQEIN